MDYESKIKAETAKQIGEFERYIETLTIKDSELQFVIKKSLLANGYRIKSKLIFDDEFRISAEELEITRLEKMYY